MLDVDSIHQMIDENRDIKEVRTAIVDLIESNLQSLKNSLGYWEKAYFANAIAQLSSSINLPPRQTNTSWLGLCLLNVEKALVPVNQRSNDNSPQNKQIEAMTYEKLVEEINSLRQMKK